MKLGECCYWSTPEKLTGVCGRVYMVCTECDRGINDCTEGYCGHEKESANDH